ncbi:MAG: flagellar biosynthetic protein FliR [Myxococcota bacterium]
MLILFSLVLARVGGLFMGAPVFSAQGMPQRLKAMIVLGLSAALLPVVPPATLPEGSYAVLVAMVGELAVGFAIGLLARLFLTAFQVAGAMIAFQMGFAMARTFDMNSRVQAPVIATVYLQLVTILFLLVDGHHVLIRSLAASYETFPLGGSLQAGALSQTLFTAGGAMYEAGARIAGPVTGLMLLINSLMGLLNRILPQLSIFNIGFPLTVMSGLIAITFSIPEVVHFFVAAYAVFEDQIIGIFVG